MGIKRCPSFSKRPGFPCGLRVLLVDADVAASRHAEQLLKDCSYSVTLCSSSADAVARLDCGSFDVVLADKAVLGGATRERQQLLDSCKHLPCILMGLDSSPADVVAGIKLGAVDFLQKPLSPLKLQNIWQHTVRKAMSNMTLECDAGATGDSDAAAVMELAAMSAIMEEDEEAGDAAAARNSTSAKCPAASNAAVALATSSSFYTPTQSLSRSASSAATAAADASASPGAPDSPAAKFVKRSRHAQVHSCPSTRSLNSMSSCYSTLQLAVPNSPPSPCCTETEAGVDLGSEDAAAEAAAASASGRQSPSAAGITPSSSPGPCCPQQQQQRQLRKAVRHPVPCTPASKPPLASKPSPAAAPAAGQAAGAGATTAGPMPAGTAGFGSVPLPAGLGPLPQGCVWGMPMCPLACAPGIVPPAGGSAAAGAAAQQAALPGMPPMPWMMPPMPYGMPPFMGGYPGMGMGMPPMPMGPYGPGMMGAGAYPADHAAMMMMQSMMMAPGQPMPYCMPGMQGPMQGMGMPQQAVPAEAASGAGLAAALNAQLAGMEPCMAVGAPAVAADPSDSFDFMLGDISAEDDLNVGMNLLDGELTQLEKDGLRLPAELQELQALEQVQQQQQAAKVQRVSFDCSTASQQRSRVSFDCSAGGSQQQQRGRVSFDCSAASTATGARGSFDCSAASTGALPRRASQRVSFEVNCCNSGKGAAASAATGSASASALPARLQSVQSGSAGLLGSLGDLFAACSGDSCSDGEDGMTRVDSCGMLADLHTLFGAEDDGCSPAAAAAAASLFDDVMEDTLPLGLAMKKSSSLSELINAGLPALAAN